MGRSFFAAASRKGIDLATLADGLREWMEAIEGQGPRRFVRSTPRKSYPIRQYARCRMLSDRVNCSYERRRIAGQAAHLAGGVDRDASAHEGRSPDRRPAAPDRPGGR